MNRESILKKLGDNNLLAYEVENALDPDCDIVLKDCDIDGFSKFAYSVGINVAFYKIDFIEEELYIVDEDEVRIQIEQMIQEKINDRSFADDMELTIDDFQDVISAKMKEIHRCNTEARRKISLLTQPEVLFADIYVLYNGVSVGISLENDYMKNCPMAFEIIDGLEDSISEMISPRLSQYEIDEVDRFEQWQREIEEKKRVEQERRRVALGEMRLIIENDPSLIDCTNQRLRHAYAKRIISENAERFEVTVTIGDVEVIADEVFKKKKRNKA